MLDQENYKIIIPKDKPIQEDYNALKELGLSYIQQFSKQLWTDFNASDPGVTTLELLCYALTDLAYRTQLPLEDLLTEENQQTPFHTTNSYNAQEIFSHNPLTIQDYRKLIIDRHPNVRNVWFYPMETAIKPTIYIHKNQKQLTLKESESLMSSKVTLKGLYEIKVETIGKPKKTLDEVLSTLQAHRNLSEDFYCLDYVEFEYVTICMDLLLDGTVKPDIIKEEVYRQLYLYCAPHLNRYSLNQMLAKGYSVEDIFAGPQLKNGFFDEEELADFDKREVLYVSDLINIFMDIPGVANISKIHLNSYAAKSGDIDLDTELKKDEEYCLHLTDSRKAFKFFVDRKDKQANKINFYYNGLKLYEPEVIPESKLIPTVQPVPTVADQWEAVHSNYRNIKPYYSIQNEFPKAYLLGKEGISGLETEERKIQRLQFKGFLLLLEQMMADYLAQLQHMKNLFSWSSKADYRSYLYQALSPLEIKNLEMITTSKYGELFDNITNDDENADYHEQVLNISSEENFDRRNRFLNHLIARVNDSFVEFSIVEFFKKNNKTYGKHSIIADKKSFLRTYPAHSANRLRAMDYSKSSWNTTNISGYEMRVAKKLGLTNYITSNPDLVFRHSLAHPVLTLEDLSTADLTEFYNYNNENFDKQFGFHLLEHLLLRPRSDNDEMMAICNEYNENIVDCTCNDPYSFQLTAVLPGWLPITLNDGFRTYVERVFREELPAHLAIKLCWVGPQQMLQFEKCFFDFFKHMQERKKLDCALTKADVNPYLPALINILGDLDNVYYPSHLVECEDIDYDYMTNEVSKHPTILGQTKLNAKLNFGVRWRIPTEPVYVRFPEFQNILTYRESVDGISFELQGKDFAKETMKYMRLRLSDKKAEKGRITFANNKFLNAFVSEEEIATSFRLKNNDTQEEDIIWCHWKDESLLLNLNKQVNFLFTLKETSVDADFDTELKFTDTLVRHFKIHKIQARADLRQFELEQMWLEYQYDSSFSLPEIKNINIPQFMTVFMSEVKNRSKNQRKV